MTRPDLTTMEAVAKMVEETAEIAMRDRHRVDAGAIGHISTGLHARELQQFRSLISPAAMLKLIAYIRELEGELEPFARCVEHLEGQLSFHGKMWTLGDEEVVEAMIRRVDGAVGPSSCDSLSLGDFRRARTALRTTGGEDVK